MSNVTYTVKRHRRAKHLRLRVTPKGEVIVTLPWRAPLRFAETLVGNSAAWLHEAKRRMEARREAIPTTGSYHTHRARALKLIRQKVVAWNTGYGFSYKTITVKRQTTRWGSCSSQKNLNFNYRLFFLPEPLIDYVVVHELCHLAQMNHSRAFWDLVARTVPDHRARRLALRQYTLL